MLLQIDQPHGPQSFCAAAVVEGDVIVRTAPKLAKFRGQPCANLRRWAASIGATVLEVQVEEPAREE
jgi:hypothetical protein